MMKRTFSAIAAAALTAGTLALSTPVRAAEGEDSVTVNFSDLDVGTAAGKARFDRRVRNAAREMCGWVQFQPLDIQTKVVSCHKDVIADAQAGLETALARKASATRLSLRGN